MSKPVGKMGKAAAVVPPFVQAWRAAVLSRNCTLTSTQRLTLVTLAQFADSSGGSCFPAASTVAKCAGLSRKAVHRALAAGCELGWISRWNRPGTKGKNWRADAYDYQLMLPQGEDSQSPAEERQSPASTHAEDSVSIAEDCESSAGDSRSHDLALDLALYQKKEKNARAPKRPSQEEACSASPSNGEATPEPTASEIAMEAVGAYNVILAHKHDLPTAHWSNGKTRTAETRDALPLIRDLIQREGFTGYSEFFEAYFNECANDSWLRGDGEYTDGICPVRFAYLMQPKVIEKVYDTSKPRKKPLSKNAQEIQRLEEMKRRVGAAGRVAINNAEAEASGGTWGDGSYSRPQLKPFPEPPPEKVLTEAEEEAKRAAISEGIRRVNEALGIDTDKAA